MKTIVRSIKLTVDEDQAIRQASTRAGVPWSTWAREVLLRVARPALSMANRIEESVMSGERRRKK